MRYLVQANVKLGQEAALLRAIDDRTLGEGSVAGGEYLRNMQHAGVAPDGTTQWVEVCYCPTPLEEELPYWNEFFDVVKVQDAHARTNCRDENGTEPWACGDCDCTARLEQRLSQRDDPFLPALRRRTSAASRSDSP